MGPRIEIGLLAEDAADLVHVAVELLQQALEAGEHRVAGGRLAGVLAAHEGLEGRGVAIFGAPETACLVDAALDLGPLRRPVLRRQLWGELSLGRGEPCRAHGCGGRSPGVVGH